MKEILSKVNTREHSPELKLLESQETIRNIKRIEHIKKIKEYDKTSLIKPGLKVPEILEKKINNSIENYHQELVKNYDAAKSMRKLFEYAKMVEIRDKQLDENKIRLK